MATRAKDLADFIGTGALAPALRLEDAAGGEYVGLDAPTTVSSSFTLTMVQMDRHLLQMALEPYRSQTLEYQLVKP